MQHEVTLTNYRYVFKFESNFVYKDAHTWMTNNWTSGFYYCGIYIILVFGGQYLMKNRPKFELRKLLVLWNTSLAVFSIAGATRTIPEFVDILTRYGLYHSVCVSSYLELDRVSGFWGFVFALSKLLELGDTVFIVLRKQPLMFLHWYHHITVLLYTWFSYMETSSSGRWFIVMNYCIHSVMYSYYALRAAHYRPPRWLSMVITSLQLLQMVIGCGINIWAQQLLSNKVDCRITQLNNQLSLLMYFSYFVLFARFFYTNYLLRGQARKTIINASVPSKSKVQ